MFNQRFVFADIDGVLNSMNTRYVPPCGYGEGTWDGIDYHCIHRLNDIIEQVDAKLVLSSSWKHYKPLEYCEKHLQRYGLNFPIKERTRNLITHNHGAEILHWITKNSWRIKSFVVLDDLTKVYGWGFDDRVVLTSDEVGLTSENAKRAIEILQTDWIR